ncbi:Uma2 family endonuclease [Saccharothrix mutabilis subsp. mutabilis]|uniref:Uma2 family endonuclease n=2 Tax=Saccharothrix mutabilis TaxID=33921 RepID=A0ABP3DGH0_9PSEU
MRGGFELSAMLWPDHLLTLEEWDALPEDESHHVELVEGVLLGAPKPAPKHQFATSGLWATLRDQLPGDVTPVPDVDVVINAIPPVTVRAPDVVVVHNKRFLEYPKRFDADDVLLAVEIVSPGTGRTDRIFKPIEYADAGIPHYWLLELDDQVTLTAFDLVGGGYQVVASGTGKVEVPSPFPVVLDLPALITG